MNPSNVSFDNFEQSIAQKLGRVNGVYWEATIQKVFLK